MKKIGLIGYGEHGVQFEHLIRSVHENIDFLYFDDYAIKKKNVFAFSDFLDDQFSDIEFLVALGYKHLKIKKKLIDKLINGNRKLFTFIHPTAVIDNTATIDKGTVIFPNVTIDKNVQVGKGCLLNISVTIAHDCIIGDCSFIAPSVTLSGFISVGSSVFIGTGVCIANKISIGECAVVGIGSVITKNIESSQYVIGNPQIIVPKLRLY